MASPTREGVEYQQIGAKNDTGHEIAESDGREDEISWPQKSEMNATLQVSSVKKADPLATHGGSTFQKKRLARELFQV